jgi:hypothetical protein
MKPTLTYQGIITIGSTHYHVQHYSPSPNKQHMVYVFKKHNLLERGLVFKTEADYHAWYANAPKQLSLFE